MNVASSGGGFDLQSYLQKFGAEHTQKSEWEIECPQCGRRKLSVNVERGQWRCFICEQYQGGFGTKRKAVRGAGGVISLIGWLENCSLEKAREMVTGGNGSVRNSYFRMQQAHSSGPVEIPPPPHWKPINTTLPYCVERGITQEDIRQFGLVFCDGGRYRNRLIFPVWEGNRLVYYQARAMWRARPGETYIKALNPPKEVDAASPNEVLMNLDTARYFDRVAIVEGPIDCVHAGPSAVATLGKKISVAQILKMKRAGVRAIDLIWDGPSPAEPEGAWPEMRQAACQLSGIFDTRLVFLPQGDPGDYTRAEIEQFRQQAKPASAVSGLAQIG